MEKLFLMLGNRRRLNELLLFFLLSVSSVLFSQEKKKIKDIVAVHGYVKYMPSASFLELSDVSYDHLIHNRINIRGYLSDNVTAKLELRNRMFFGHTVNNLQPSYGDLIGQDNGEVDMSYLLLNEDRVVVNAMIDRAALEFNKGNWNIVAGRQRINWGINLLWNTNDLFNAYNFVDFDYQERPGSDAIKVQYYTGDISNVQMAYKFGEDMDNSVLAGLLKLNKWKYDMQLLVANYYTDYAVGGGWAGNIKNAGFKGEVTLFQPKSNFSDTSGVFLTSTSVDYSFKNGIYFNVSFLYNSDGVTHSSNITSQQQEFSGNLSAKRLMPTRYSCFTQVSGAFNPKLNGSMAIIYGQGADLVFLMPALAYSLHEDWDLDVTGQVYYGKENDQFKNLGNAFFLRLRYSY